MNSPALSKGGGRSQGAVFGGDAVAYCPRLYILLIAQKKLAQAAIRRNGQLYREAGIFLIFFWCLPTGAYVENNARTAPYLPLHASD